MKEHSTHITVILDRTGSMESIRDDTIGGFNAFLGKQQAEPGEATLTLVQFDSQDPYEVLHRFAPIGQIPLLDREHYVPRASTPLLDALGRGINDLEQSLAKLPEAERPAKVVFAVVTDGQENASREFHRGQIIRMIKEKTEKDGWQFVFLSADLDAITEAHAVGFQPSSSLLFEKSAKGSAMAWECLSRATSHYRTARKAKVEFDKQEPPPEPDEPKA